MGQETFAKQVFAGHEVGKRRNQPAAVSTQQYGAQQWAVDIATMVADHECARAGRIVANVTDGAGIQAAYDEIAQRQNAACPQARFAMLLRVLPRRYDLGRGGTTAPWSAQPLAS